MRSAESASAARPSCISAPTAAARTVSLRRPLDGRSGVEHHVALHARDDLARRPDVDEHLLGIQHPSQRHLVGASTCCPQSPPSSSASSASQSAGGRQSTRSTSPCALSVSANNPAPTLSTCTGVSSKPLISSQPASLRSLVCDFLGTEGLNRRRNGASAAMRGARCSQALPPSDRNAHAEQAHCLHRHLPEGCHRNGASAGGAGEGGVCPRAMAASNCHAFDEQARCHRRVIVGPEHVDAG